MKKLCYLLMIISYLMIGFVLVYFNKINSNYEGSLGLILSITAIVIWVTAVLILFFKKTQYLPGEITKLDKWLKALALAPIVLLVLVPALLYFLIHGIVSRGKKRIKNKCKALLEKGFVLSKEKRNKETVYLLVKENCVVKICEFDRYEISLDIGVTFTKISQSELMSGEDKKEIEYRLWMYEACEYREKEDYEPTEIILGIVAKYF